MVAANHLFTPSNERGGHVNWGFYWCSLSMPAALSSFPPPFSSCSQSGLVIRFSNPSVITTPIIRRFQCFSPVTVSSYMIPGISRAIQVIWTCRISTLWWHGFSAPDGFSEKTLESIRYCRSCFWSQQSCSSRFMFTCSLLCFFIAWGAQLRIIAS